MKYAYAATVLVSFVLTGTGLADDCLNACNSARDACLSKTEANRSSCAAEYASCLGFNPYEKEPYVQPTSCSKGDVQGDQCLPGCEDKKNKCLTTPGSNKSTCSSDYDTCKTSCTGNTNGNKNTSCGPACAEKKNKCLTTPGSNKSTCSSDHESCKTTCLGKTDDNKFDTDGFKGSQCIPTCEATKTKCMAAPGSNKSTCVSDCESCKTLCSSNAVGPKIDGQPPVYVAAGGRVRPLVGFLAVVAMAAL